VAIQKVPPFKPQGAAGFACVSKQKGRDSAFGTRRALSQPDQFLTLI